MRLVTFIPPGTAPAPRLGALSHGEILDVPALWAASEGGALPGTLSSMAALLAGGAAAMDLLRRLVEDTPPPEAGRFPQAAVRLLAPLPRPTSLRDCMAFPEHLLQATRGGADLLYPPAGRIDRGLAKLLGRGFLSLPKRFFEIPAYYKGNPASVVGHGADILWPDYTERFDYELEFGIFIGEGGRDIPVSEARRHIAGFTIFNDFSARDIQLKEMSLRLGPAKGKDFDTGNSLGPCLVTPDELPDPYGLKMVAEVDGEVWTDARSDGMAFSFEEIIAYISRSETLYPGDFIGGGTVGGGCGLEHGRWLAPGQTITLTVEGIGALTNTIVRAGEAGRP